MECSLLDGNPFCPFLRQLALSPAHGRMSSRPERLADQRFSAPSYFIPGRPDKKVAKELPHSCRVCCIPLEKPLHHPCGRGEYTAVGPAAPQPLLQNHRGCECVCVFLPTYNTEPSRAEDGCSGTISAGLPPGHSKSGRWVLLPFKQASHHNSQQPTCTEGGGGGRRIREVWK